MEENIVIEKLTEFGLTRQEAVIYLSLNRNKELTGYEVAKLTGISRSNVYNALSGLTDKGAAYLMEGNAARYSAVPVSEFCENVQARLQKDAEFLSKNMPEKQVVTEGYITIQGTQHIMDKIRNMLKTCEKRLYLVATNDLLMQLEPVLTATIERGIKAVILTDEDFMAAGATIYQTEVEKGQIRFITDSTYVLTGIVTGKNDDNCLYSGQENLVTVFKEALKNKITLIEMERKQK